MELAGGIVGEAAGEPKNVSHRGTETQRRQIRSISSAKPLRNCSPLGEHKASENRPLFHLLCALRDSVAISTAGFRVNDTSRS